MDSGTDFSRGALFLLAAELEDRGHAAAPARGNPNVLKVTTEHGSGLVAHQAGKFWWHESQEPVGPFCEIRRAADEIVRVLSGVPQ